MGDDSFVSSISSEDNPVSTRTPTRIDFVVIQDWELIVRARIRECETLVVFILVRILIAADCLALLVVAVALLYSSVDVGMGIAC